MRNKHDILNSPLDVPNDYGRLKVLKRQAKEQSEMGEALTLDSIVNSIDAELIATGPSAKGPNRGAIVRHGQYILWGFEGPVSKMTDAGRRLFVNTVFYAALHGDSPVLEKRINGTRDKLFGSLEFARRVPGYLNTIKSLDLPGNMKDKTFREIEKWVAENRSYLRVEDRRRLMVDEFAKRLGVPNHKKEFLDRCIQLLEQDDNSPEAFNALIRYTKCTDIEPSAAAWKQWFTENKNYLYFSDSEGFHFKIDEEAKKNGIASEDFRGWSSESLNYKYQFRNGGTEKNEPHTSVDVEKPRL